MSLHKIAICGTPQVGKHTLLMGLGLYTGFSHINKHSASNSEPNAFLDVDYQGEDLHFVAGCGVYLNPEPMIREVLSQASAVIYVLSPAFSGASRPHLSDEEHRHYFDLYVQYAHSLGSGWDSIPWLIVLNKTDLAAAFPTEAMFFPDTILHHHIRCIASQGIGIAYVWERLLQLLSLTTSS